jgi:hypothetical protein
MSRPFFSVFHPKKLFLTFARFSLESPSGAAAKRPPPLEVRFSAPGVGVLSRLPLSCGLSGTFALESNGVFKAEVPLVKREGEGD